jgi:hypothetical protein
MQYRSDLSQVKLKELLMKPYGSTIDPEMAEFEAALLRSIDQVQAGKGRVSVSEQSIARRGSPMGSVKVAPKVAADTG